MKIFKILFGIAALIVFGFFIANQFLTKEATQELDEILAPIFTEIGASYGDLEVNPARGSITFLELKAEGASATTLTVVANYDDILAMVDGTPEFFHGIDIHVENLSVKDGDDQAQIDEGDLHIEALIDVKKMQEDPEAWLEELTQQDDVLLQISGKGWDVKSRELMQALNLPKETLQLKDWSLELNNSKRKQSGSLHANVENIGKIDLDFLGTQEMVEHVSGEVRELHILTDDMTADIGSLSFTVDADIPLDDFTSEWYADIIENGESMSWDLAGKDIQLEGRDLSGLIAMAGVSDGPLTVTSFKHSLSFDKTRLKSSSNLKSNIGSADFELDVDITNVNPPEANFRKLEINVEGLKGDLQNAVMLSPIPLESQGADGFTFSFSGSLQELIGTSL